MKKNTSPIITLLALFTTVFFWSSAFVGIRIGLKDFDPSSLALFRYLIASVCMLFFYFRVHKRTSATTKEIISIFFIGVIGFAIYNIALNYGEIAVNAGITSFIISLIPVAIVILARIILKERINRIGWVGMIISLLGIIIIVFGGHQQMDFNLGIMYLIVATLSGAFYAVLHKPFLRKFNPIELTSYMIWSGTLVMLFYLPSLIDDLPKAHLSSILAIIYLGIFPGVIGYVSWSFVLARMPASKASSALYLMPLLTTLLGWLLLNEIPTVISLLGGIVALIGAIVVNSRNITTKE